MPDLLPCPFCGGSVVQPRKHLPMLECGQCAALFTLWDCRTLVEEWNRRAFDPRYADLLEAARDVTRHVETMVRRRQLWPALGEAIARLHGAVAACEEKDNG